MPELPEVEHAASRLRAAAVGRTIRRVDVHHPSHARQLPPPARRSLTGRRIIAVERRGKLQRIRLDDDRVILVHFRMTGDWTIADAAHPSPPHARVTLDLDDGTRVSLDDPRALSTVRVEPADAVDERLGPEPSDATLTPDALGLALAPRRLAIKLALLDQRLIAGVGNIYAAEALWRARIDPRAPANELTALQRRALLRALRAVLAAATGRLYRDGGGRFAVYDREGDPCRRCRRPIARFTQGGRSTYWCPACQARRRAAARP
jgi:formamidopyrimidine-DNA glycosylase